MGYLQHTAHYQKLTRTLLITIALFGGSYNAFAQNADKCISTELKLNNKSKKGVEYYLLKQDTAIQLTLVGGKLCIESSSRRVRIMAMYGNTKVAFGIVPDEVHYILINSWTESGALRHQISTGQENDLIVPTFKGRIFFKRGL